MRTSGLLALALTSRCPPPRPAAVPAGSISWPLPRGGWRALSEEEHAALGLTYDSSKLRTISHLTARGVSLLVEWYARDLPDGVARIFLACHHKTEIMRRSGRRRCASAPAVDNAARPLILCVCSVCVCVCYPVGVSAVASVCLRPGSFLCE